MPPHRSLWPREHGAYAQLLAPLATALAIARPTAAAVLIAIAGCAAFLANEPLLVVLGHRGKRMREDHGRRAARRLALLATVAGGCGIVGLALAPEAAVATALVVMVAAASIVGLAWIRAERSWWGELVAAGALPAAAAPVMVASGVAWQTALEIWIAWSIGYASSVIAVHRVLARHRTPATWRDPVFAVGLGAIAVGASLGALERPVFAVSALLAAIATVVAARPPSAHRLRTIGVVLTVASAAGGALVVATTFVP